MSEWCEHHGTIFHGEPGPYVCACGREVRLIDRPKSGGWHLPRHKRPVGCPKDIGPGVFRDAAGRVIPRERFAEDPDFAVPISSEVAYAASVVAGCPRDFGAEERLDMSRVRNVWKARGFVT